MRAWGNNESGELGDGTTTMRTSPVRVPHLTAVVAISASWSSSLATSSSVVNGFARPVSLTVLGLPAGVVASISPATVLPGYPATITFTAAPTMPSGTYPLTIRGVANGLVRTVVCQLTVANVGVAQTTRNAPNMTPVILGMT